MSNEEFITKKDFIEEMNKLENEIQKQREEKNNKNNKNIHKLAKYIKKTNNKNEEKLNTIIGLLN